MDSGAYIEPKQIMFMAAGMAGDKEFKAIPRGFYTTLIQEAFNDLNITSLFRVERQDYPMPTKTLSVDLPDDCVNVDAVYVFSGDVCEIASSHKVYWKRNYYTQGGAGYLANNKWNNSNDPYLPNNLRFSSETDDKNMIREVGGNRAHDLLFYEIENNKLMISSSCTSRGTKIHIRYRSTGGPMEDAPIIPLFFKNAIQDYVTEAALRFRMANEPSMVRVWMPMQQMYERRLDLNGMNGSWHEAIMRARTMSKAKLDDLKTYLGKAAWATGR